eukprot:Skav205256  [mRNA]  locus=scaffold1841:56862:58148:- [translate_table: standard]
MGMQGLMQVPMAIGQIQVPQIPIPMMQMQMQVPQAVPVQAGQMSEEALREAVLVETLARLLREKIGATGTVARANSTDSTVPPWRRTEVPQGEAPVSTDPTVDTDKVEQNEKVEKLEAPLEKFIRIFGLDELAAKCLLKLQDDEAAFVIESCQHRLKYAKNPSAVVMIAIRGVAAKVGRRYYGSRETAEGDSETAVAELKKDWRLSRCSE